MPADGPDLDAAAEQYEALLRARLGSPPRLSVALLGVGPDGRVCSLFPGHALLGEERRLVAAVRDSPKPPPCRLTLTLPALRAAELVVIAVLGEGKAKVVAAAIDDPSCALPVALAARSAGEVWWLLDAGAASAVRSWT